MSLALKLFLALGAVVLAAFVAFIQYGSSGGIVGLLAGCLGLLLGRLASSGRRDSAAALPATYGTVTPPAKLHAPGDALIADALLKATMNGMREGVLVLDQSLRVVTSNHAARAVFGSEANTRAGQPLSALTRHPSINAAYRAALEHNRDEQVKIELLGAERRFFELRVAPLRLDDAQGAGRGAIGVFFDITQLERLERVRQEFLSNVSHELRTPLTSILAFVETLEDGAIDDPQDGRRFVSIIRRNAERMHTLIEDILELSAIESGITQVEPQQLRLAPTVQEAMGALSAKAAARGVSLVNEVAAETVVSADPRRLEQMLLNLIDNAIKFNRAGGQVVVRHEAGGQDRVSVSDTGEGIPAEQLPRIFERFYRVDRARAREMGGTGLGLAIVKHLARAHGGEVSVRSDTGEGSTFTIELPPAGRPV